MPRKSDVVRAGSSKIKRIEIRDTNVRITIELDSKTLVKMVKEIERRPIGQKAKDSN
jgi:hypothetical protein